MESESTAAAPGRPREFCTDKALAAALDVFRSKGFQGASLRELTAAMGIKRPSLYAAFGNKEALFRRALDLYDRDRAALIAASLAAPTARGVAERLLRGALLAHVDDGGSRGCLYVTHSVACGPEAEAARAEVASRNASLEAAVRQRFERAKADGDLPDGIEPSGLSRCLVALLQGLAVQASSGVAREDLDRLGDTALLLWRGR